MTRTGSAGTESGSRARSLVLLTMLAPVSRSARFSQYIGWAWGISAGARDVRDESKSEIDDGGATGNCLPRGTFVSDLPASSVSASLLTPHKLYDYVSTPPRAP